MITHTGSFRTATPYKGAYKIYELTRLTAAVAVDIRKEITDSLKRNCKTVYINAKDVKEVDLSGINEVIYTNYRLQNTNMKLVFVYRQKSVVEKWVETTGLDRFIETAILPAHY